MVAAARRRPEPRWAGWPTEKLLDLRFRDLDVSLAGTWVAAAVERVRDELAARGLRVRPHVWLSEEWFSPDGVPGIAIPFYLAHPRLVRLERSQVFEVEGGRRDDCLRILRHEAGHAVQHAFRLHRLRRWQKVFGRSSEPYPDYYRPNPSSKNHVVHLDYWYAQSHPVEDFAETFAVWLAPGSRWRTRYGRWGALKKLEFVDQLMTELAGSVPPVRTRRQVEPLRSLGKTLRQHYQEKRARHAVDQPTIFDRDLLELFSPASRSGRRGESAAAFLRRHRGEIRRLVSRWTGEYQFTLDLVFREMIQRCSQLRLRAVGSERRLKLDFAILLTARTVQTLSRRGQWHAL